MRRFLHNADEERTFRCGLLCLTLLAAILRVAFLAATPLTSDDYGVIGSAFEFVERGQYGTAMWQHPKLRDLFTYGSMALLGTGVWGVKGASLLCGIATVPAIGLAARRLFSPAAGLLAAFFLAVDPVHIDFSRQAIQEVYMPLFTLLAVLGALRYRETGEAHLPVLSGLLFGLGLAGKWYVIFPLGVTLAGLVLMRLRSCRGEGGATGEICFLLAALGLLPAVTYLLTYYPWFARSGNDLFDWLAAQRFMAAENLVHQGFNGYLMEVTSRPLLWFVAPSYWVDFTIAGDHPVVWAAITNPPVWMLTLPACCFLTYRGLKEQRYGYCYLALLFWVTYLPLALARRPIWLNSSFAVTPFAFMAVAWMVTTLLRDCRRRGLILYLGLVLTTAAPLYVLAIGKGYGNPLLHHLIEQFRPSNEKQ